MGLVPLPFSLSLVISYRSALAFDAAVSASVVCAFLGECRKLHRSSLVRIDAEACRSAAVWREFVTATEMPCCGLWFPVYEAADSQLVPCILHSAAPLLPLRLCLPA